MKERTRESVFSMLGGKLKDTWAIDLFAGTGILAFESVSRGSQRAILFELSRPTLGSILDNMHKLGLEQQLEVHHADTLRVLRHLSDTTLNWTHLPWIVFCCPPYRMWTEEGNRICQGIAELYERCPVGSQFVCETDKSFDLAAALPGLDWDVRKYDPAFISIARKLNTAPEID